MKGLDMRYVVKGNYIGGTPPLNPPVLARLSDDRDSGELYLSIPRVWVPIGEPVIGEMMFTGDWDALPSDQIESVIEKIDAIHMSENLCSNLVSLDPRSSHVIVNRRNGRPMGSYSLSARAWVDVPEDDPIQHDDGSDWYWLTPNECGILQKCLIDAYQRC